MSTGVGSMHTSARSRFVRSTTIPIAVILAVVAVEFFIYTRRPVWEPGQGLQRAWARRGVDRPNVVLVTLDTTRADHLHCYGDQGARTPALDALADRGVLFSQAASAAPLTLPAHCSIMTGLYPTYHGVRLNGTTALGQTQTTLAEVFRKRGYETAAFIAAFVLD